jgi:AcrR family transcriptional regulator
VLYAAMEAIAEVGVDKLRMTHIAERAGMSPGHILYYFGQKNRILFETLHWSESNLERSRANDFAGIADPNERLQRFVELYLPVAPDDIRWRLWTQVWSHPPRDPETVGELQGLYGTWRRDLTGILNAIGIATGSESLARQICYALDGITIDFLTGTGPESNPDAIALGLEVTARLIKGARTQT